MNSRLVGWRSGLVSHAVLLLALMGGSMLPEAARAQSFQALDPPSGPFSDAFGVSADGSVVVGSGFGGWGPRAIRWNEAGEAEALDMLAGAFDSAAYGVSADGSVAVGWDINAASIVQAVRWNAAGDVEALNSLVANGRSEAYDVSADGSVVVGFGFDGSTDQAVRWNAAGDAEVLDSLAPVSNSYAYGVSADGLVAVGFGFDGSTDQAVRWNAAGDAEVLDSLAPGNSSFARDVSADGSIVVGYGLNGSVFQAIRWNAAGEAEGLDSLGGNSYAYSISADGSVVVGASGGTAVRWTDAQGVQAIADVLAGNGVDLTGWTLSEARGVSADGTTIVGRGNGPSIDPSDAWVARDMGLITMEGATQSLASVGAVGQGAQLFLDGLLGGQQEYALQHAANAYVPTYRPLGYAPDPGADFPNIKPREPDLLRWRVFGYAEGHAMSDPDGGYGLGQFGASYALADHAVIGGALGFGGSTTDMAFDGEADFLGLSGSVFAAYVPPTGFQAIFSATGAGFDADIERGYENGSGLDSSEGETEGIGYGAALRVGYAFDLTPQTALTPFASFQATRVELDGYTETTGPFPAEIGDIEDTAEISRLGLEGRHALSDQTWLWASAAWAHRFDDEGAEIDAQLIGLFGISGAALTLDEDWAELTGGVSYGFDDGRSRLTASATLYVPGEDISATGRVGYSRAF